MVAALLLTGGGCYWWGTLSASTPVFVAGTEARAACIVVEAVKQDGVEYCPVWLNMRQIGAVPATAAGRK